MHRPLITFLTDFGTRDAFVGIMKGVVSSICPEARIIDLTHGVPPQGVRAGALILRSAVPYFPDGTIHCAVIDPGVGSARAAVLVQTPRAWLIGPDNGLLHPAATLLGRQRVIELVNPAYRLPQVSHTFHGRDVFAPAAAHLAAGVAPESFGPERRDLTRLDVPEATVSVDGIDGEVIHVDTFGNCVTNIGEADLARFPRLALSVSIESRAFIPLGSTYAEAAPGELLGLVGSWGLLEIAVRDGNAAAYLEARVGTVVRVRRE